MFGLPKHGDVLITTREDVHYVSIVPNRSRFLSKSLSLSEAQKIGQQWLRTHPGVSLWHQTGDTTPTFIAFTEVPESGR